MGIHQHMRHKIQLTKTIFNQRIVTSKQGVNDYCVLSSKLDLTQILKFALIKLLTVSFMLWDLFDEVTVC